MKKLIAPLLMTFIFLACVCIGPALADSSEAPSKDVLAVDVAAIKQIGQDMGDAMVTGDTAKLSQIFADDWASVGPSGKATTKEDFLRNHISGDSKLESFDLGPIDVQVLGNSAVAQGSVIETRGKETGIKMIYADLLEKRSGKWVVVRSMGARVK